MVKCDRPMSIVVQDTAARNSMNNNLKLLSIKLLDGRGP